MEREREKGGEGKGGGEGRGKERDGSNVRPIKVSPSISYVFGSVVGRGVEGIERSLGRCECRVSSAQPAAYMIECELCNAYD